jgi:hypothetical protein
MDKEIRRAWLDTPDNFNHVIGQGIEMCRIADNFSDHKKFYIVNLYPLKNEKQAPAAWR